MKRAEITKQLIFWRAMAAALGLLLAAQSFNILTGSVKC